MDLNAKPEWQTPSLVSLTGVRDAELAKDPFFFETTISNTGTGTASPARLGTSTVS